MKIKINLSKCEEVLIANVDGDLYPFDVSKNVLAQAFDIATEFANREDNYMVGDEFKAGRLVLSVNLPDKTPLRLAEDV